MKKERKKLRIFFAILVICATIFGMFVSFNGFGENENIKEQLKYGLDINGGANIVLEAQTQNMSDAKVNKIMTQTKAVIEKRVNSMGISEATVTKEGTNRLRVEMPGVTDGNESIERIGETAQLKMTLADGTEYLTGTDIKNATAELDSNSSGYKITMDFTTEGSKKFAKATELASSGQVTPTVKDEDGTTVDATSVVIWLDNDIITAPTCENKIDSPSCEITQPNGMTEQYATDTAALIRGGSLPVELKEISTSIQTATIGENALNTAIKAGGIGMLLVMLLMLIFFGVAGISADISLATYIIALLWLMNAMDAVLTLPGIAGIILGLGMAVDSNVIIFTRIKDELKQGRSSNFAIEQGIKRATTTVLDAQVTTIIGTIILYYLGSTSVKGFALTLLMSVIISLITTLLITTNFIKVLSYTKIDMNKVFGFKFKDHEPIPFLSKKKLYYTFSICLIVVGLGIGFIGGWNVGIDVTGGTRIEINTEKHIDENKISEIIKSYDLNEEITYSGDNRENVIIKTKEALNASKRAEIGKTICDAVNVDYKTSMLSAEQFGGTMGKEIRNNAILSMILAAIAMLIYIALRFRKVKYGSASVVALFHDVLIMCSMYGLFQFTINSPFIAALLTVIGYSINDTIVVFDRIRENSANEGKGLITDTTINTAITQTLGRSIITSLTTIVAIVPLIIMGSETMNNFTIPLLIGVLAGTYSSIFLASPVLSDLSNRELIKIEEKKKEMKKSKYQGAKKKNAQV